MSWITEVKNLLATSYIKIAVFIFISSLVFMFPGLFSMVGLKPFYAEAVKKYSAEILVALVASTTLLLFWAIYNLSLKLWHFIDSNILEHLEWWRNRKGRLKIIKATYGASNDPKDVVDRLKDLIKKQDDKDSLRFKVDDDIFLESGKVDDDMSGSLKTFRIEYLYRHTEEYKQHEQVEISNVRANNPLAHELESSVVIEGSRPDK